MTTDWLDLIEQDRDAPDEPRWFRDDLDARVDAALRGVKDPPLADTASHEIVPTPAEYLLGTNPSHAHSVVVDGRHVGFETLTGDAKHPGYRGVAAFDDQAPLFAIALRRALAAPAMERALSGDAEMDTRFDFHTNLPRLPRALLRVQGFGGALAAAARYVPLVEVTARDEQPPELVVQLRDAGTPEAVAAGMNLLRATRAAVSVVAQQPDALSTASGKRTLDADDDVEGLMRAVVEATSWLEGDVGRVGAGAEARLALDEGALRREASLSVALAGEGAALRLRGAVPDDTPTFTLAPQRGWRTLFARATELRVEDAALDDAFLIHAPATSAALLRARRLELLRLAEREARVTCEAGHLEVSVDALSRAAVDVVDVTSAALLLWRNLTRPALPHGDER